MASDSQPHDKKAQKYLRIKDTAAKLLPIMLPSMIQSLKADVTAAPPATAEAARSAKRAAFTALAENVLMVAQEFEEASLRFKGVIMGNDDQAL